MNRYKRLLIETLVQAAEEEDEGALGEDFEDRLRACFLLLTSHSVETIPLIERLGYETYDDESTGTTVPVQGLSVPESGLLLTEVVEALLEMKQIPEELARAAPDLEYEDLMAALVAIRCILYSLQWSGWDKQHKPIFKAGEAERSIQNSLRSLRHFRDTGEP